MLSTWLTERFRLDVPVVGAPMAGPGEGPLAAAVSAAGGLGMVGVGGQRSADWVRGQARVASEPGRAFGIGLMAWMLEQDDAPLAAALASGPELVSPRISRSSVPSIFIVRRLYQDSCESTPRW